MGGYINGAAISMVIAAVVGGIVAIPLYLYLFRQKVGSWFAKRKKQL